MAEDMRCGEMRLSEKIDVVDESGRVVTTVAFRDAVTIVD